MLFAAIKGNSSQQRSKDEEFIHWHPVAISGLRIHLAVQSCYRSASNCDLDPVLQGVTDRAPQIGFWLCTGRPVVSGRRRLTDRSVGRSLCVWSLLKSVVILFTRHRSPSAGCLMLSEKQIRWRRANVDQLIPSPCRYCRRHSFHVASENDNAAATCSRL